MNAVPAMWSAQAATALKSECNVSVCVCFSFKHGCEMFVAVGQDSSQWIQVYM